MSEGPCARDAGCYFPTETPTMLRFATLRVVPKL
jgi:hypothetical protein